MKKMKSVKKKGVKKVNKKEVERMMNEEFVEEERRSGCFDYVNWDGFDEFVKEKEMKKKKSVVKNVIVKEKKMDGRLRMSTGECKVEKWVKGVKVLIGTGSFERCMNCVRANAGKGYRLSRNG